MNPQTRIDIPSNSLRTGSDQVKIQTPLALSIRELVQNLTAVFARNKKRVMLGIGHLEYSFPAQNSGMEFVRDSSPAAGPHGICSFVN